ncbi:MAG: nuclear transport factor 2 family protein [Pseudomonadales bacterium]
MTQEETLAAKIQRMEDIEAIRTLKYRYCQACDDDHNPAKLRPLFTEDATWEASTMGPAHGREAIAKLLGDLGQSGTIRNSAHNALNPIITVEGDTARGEWRLIMLYTGVYPSGELHYSRIIGWYNETYQRTSEGWQIKSLYCQVEEAAPYLLAPDKALT